MVAVVVLGGIGVWLMRGKIFWGKGCEGMDAGAELARKRIEELQPDF
jgi:hypothetical protein